MHAWGCVWEHCVQAIQCLSEKWPCVCLSDCIFFSTICMPVCLHQTLHVYCILYIQVCLTVCVCVFRSLAWGSSSCVRVSCSECLNSQKRKKRGSKGKTEWRAGRNGGGWFGGGRRKNWGNGVPHFQVQVAGENGKRKKWHAASTHLNSHNFVRLQCVKVFYVLLLPTTQLYPQWRLWFSTLILML